MMQRPARLAPILLSTAALFAPIGIVLSPREGDAVIVLAASSASAATIVAEADGAIMSSAGRFGLVARSTRSDFVGRLYRAGAIAVLGGGGRGGCGAARPALARSLPLASTAPLPGTT